MLCVDNSSSSDTDNPKNIFLVSGKWNTFGVNGGFAKPKIRFCINFSEEKKKNCLSLHYNGNNRYCLLTSKNL